MDKITFDFENNTIEINDRTMNAVHSIPGLSMQKARILAAAGVIQLDLSSFTEVVQDLYTGKITEEEFAERSRTMIEDMLKSRFHEELN
ncbi:MAG: hypothetical protein K6D03_07625 [Solobacterium sp.]|nr:hypothetical protein [Solobacterium sp.]